jgi:hypothetical protein
LCPLSKHGLEFLLLSRSISIYSSFNSSLRLHAYAPFECPWTLAMSDPVYSPRGLVRFLIVMSDLRSQFWHESFPISSACDDYGHCD